MHEIHFRIDDSTYNQLVAISKLKGYGTFNKFIVALLQDYVRCRRIVSRMYSEACND